MTNPVQIYYSPTTTNTPTLGVGATDSNIALNGPDEKLFYYDGTTTKNLDMGNVTLLLAATPGTLTASKALIADASSKLDNLKVDNLDLNGNTLSSSDTNGDVIISPNGTGDIDAASSTIKNVTDPASAQDAATKAYVDSVSIGLLDFKNSVVAATESDVNLAATTGGALQDGVTLVDGERVLLKAQTAGAENGIYDAVTAANPSTWVRSTDADANAEVTAGMFCFVEEGTANADAGFVLSTNDPITLDTTALTFAQFSGAGQITAGTGMTKTGNTMNVIAGTGMTANADDIALDTSYVGHTSTTTLGTITTGTWDATVIDQAYGGTGADLSALAGSSLVKNNSGGTAFEAAVLDTDYIGPSSLIGGSTF